MNNKTFEKLISLLRATNPHIPLPLGFEQFLREHMNLEKPCTKTRRVLEKYGVKPKKAYFVIDGLIMVQGYADGEPYTASLYRPCTIVALNAFMRAEAAKHTITAIKGAQVWSISSTSMSLLYEKWPEMRAMALQTALDYMDLKKAQRSALLAIDEEERVLKFYQVFDGLLPAKGGPLRDKEIASYLTISKASLIWYRKQLKQAGLLSC